jgi:hypothetical protein
MLCEFRFENFNARGEDAYLDRFSSRLDTLFGAGWSAADIHQDQTLGGWWQIVLFKDFTDPPLDARRGTGARSQP